MSAAPANEDRPVAERLGELLAEIWATPLMTLPGGRDHLGPKDLYLGDFCPDLSERAAELLEEIGL